MTNDAEGVKFRIEHLDNETFVATLLDRMDNSSRPRAAPLGHLLHDHRPYDDEGALYYVVVVVFIYGFSIILMIGSLVRKNQKDTGINKYMKEMDKVRQLERRQMKFKTRLMMQKTKIKGVLGPSRSFGEQHSDRKERKPKLDTKVWLASLRQDSRTSMWSTDSGREYGEPDEQLSPLLQQPQGSEHTRQFMFPGPASHEIPLVRIEGVAPHPNYPGFPYRVGAAAHDPDEQDRLLMYLDADEVLSQSSSSVVGTLHPLPEEEEEEEELEDQGRCYANGSHVRGQVIDIDHVPIGEDQQVSDCSEYTLYLGDDYV